MTENLLTLDRPDESEQGPPLLTLPSPGTRTEPSPREQGRDAAFYAVATDRDVTETEGIVRNGWTRQLDREAGTTVEANLSAILDTALEEDPASVNVVIEEAIEDLRQTELFARFLPDSMVAALRVNARGSQNMAIDRIARLVMTGDAIAERTESAGMTGAVNNTLDFAEILLDPLDIVHQRTYRNLVTRYEALLVPGVSIEDFEAGLQDILDDAQDAGFFSNENRFHFNGFLDTLANGIYSPEQLVNETLGWLDLFATGAFETVPIAARLTRGLRDTTAIVRANAAATAPNSVVPRGVAGAVIDAGRDTLSGINLLAPSAARTRVITDILTRAITLDSAAITNPSMHTLRSIGTPSTVRGNFMSAPEHEAIRNFELNSTVLRSLREIVNATGRVFDDETIEAFATQFVEDRKRYLRSTGNSRIIDVEVGVDEFNNIIAMDVLGTTRGTYFRTEGAAEAAAEFGDEVIAMADGTWGIMRRNNISADNFDFLEDLGYTGDIQGLMLYRATEPEALGDGFWARWGSQLAQGDEATSSHLFRAESVMQRAMHQINGQTKQITRAMRPREITEVYNAFEEMASSPTRDAFTLDQFDNWFVGRFQREPTQAQQALYLLQQERLDAELFINANDAYRRAVDMNARTIRLDTGETIVVPQARSTMADNALVYDIDAQRVVPLRELGEDAVIYRNVGERDIPGEVQYIVGQTLESRSVRHSDFFARNSGGHRGYIVNEMQFLLKQPSVRRYADGSERQEAPRTLAGVRTREEADKMQRGINSIIDDLVDEVPVGRMSADEYLDAVQAASNSRRLNDTVRANNGFNPAEITNVSELVDFARARGLDLRTRFSVVAEGQRLDEMADLTWNPFRGLNSTHGDDVRINVSRGGRGSLPLMGYGGRQVATRSTQDVIEGAYASSVARMTEASYRIRAGQGLIKASLDAGVIPRAAWDEIKNLPLRTQLERISKDRLIDTSGATGANANIGRRLQLDLERLMFRLKQRSFVSEQWESLSRRMSNFLYNKNIRWGSSFLDRRSSDPLSALRALAFDAYLGMFNMSQLLMQSVQVVNIVGIAGVNGMKGAAMYGPLRMVLNNGHEAVTRRVGRLLEKATGLTEDQFVDMVQMFRESGRGIVDNNLAEMTMAEDAASTVGRAGSRLRQGIRDVREAGRIFFKEGDLVARITGFNTAYLEAVAKFGPRTANNKNAFNNWVTWREQVLTQGMTAASRQGYEQLPFMQFMTYQLRINEAIFAGTFSNSKSVLTGAEKIRLGLTHLAMFGAMSNTATGFLSQYLEANYDLAAPEALSGFISDENFVRIAQRGMMDAVLSYISGEDTAASSRFSSSMGLYNIMDQIAREHPAAVLGGPSVQFGVTATRTAVGTLYEGLRAIATGNAEGLQTEITEFARLTSSGNYTYNAITALMHGRYLTKRGGPVAEDLTSMDAVFLAFGIPLEEIDTAYSYLAQRRIMGGWYRHTAQQVTDMHNQAHEAMRRGDYDRANFYYRAIGETLGALAPWEREQVERQVRDDERSMTNSLMVELFRRDVEAGEQVR